MLLRLLLLLWLLHASLLRSQLVLSCNLLGCRRIAGSGMAAVRAVGAAAGLHNDSKLLTPDLLSHMHRLLQARH